MGEIIDLGEIRRVEFVKRTDLEKIPLRVQAIEFLGTYGISFVDADVLSRGIFGGKRTVEGLAVFYLNWMLERRLGPEFFLEGNVKDITKKFKGLHLFKPEGLGPLRWAVKKINEGVYDNFSDVHGVIYRDDSPGGGLILLYEKDTDKMFILDPIQKSFKEKSFRIGRCWSWRDGRDFFCVNKNREDHIFILDQKQGFEEVLAEAKKQFKKRKFEKNFS